MLGLAAFVELLEVYGDERASTGCEVGICSLDPNLLLIMRPLSVACRTNSRAESSEDQAHRVDVATQPIEAGHSRSGRSRSPDWSPKA